MTAAETKELLEVLRAAGVSHYKTPDLELTIEKQEPIQASDAADPVKHKLEEMTSLLKLDDVSLVARLFPSGEEESA